MIAINQSRAKGRLFGFLFVIVIFYAFLLVNVDSVSIIRVRQQHLLNTREQTKTFHSVASIIALNNQRSINHQQQRVIKRDIGGNFCGVVLVLDNSFLQRYGNNRARAIKAAQLLFSSANEIFLGTTFSIKHEDVHYRGYGNTLVRIEFDDNRLFSNDDDVWQREDLEDRLLKRMDEHYSTYDACLVYLLTDKVIVDTHGTEYDGFSYGEGRTICWTKLNVGVVSIYPCQAGTSNTACVRTLAHEFAHSWGAPHDQHNSSLPDGDFLMTNTYASWPGPNNLKFSSISNIAIAYAIQEISKDCFIPNGGHCGNLIVEGNEEECDSGQDTACCTKCKLNLGAQCSPVNDPFCNDQCIRPELEAAPSIATIFVKYILIGIGIALVILLICALLWSINEFIIKPYYAQPCDAPTDRTAEEDGVDTFESLRSDSFSSLLPQDPSTSLISTGITVSNVRMRSSQMSKRERN